MAALSLLIWDSTDAPPVQRDGVVYLWNGFGESDSVRSLLGYVEANGDRLRGRYLAWIHDLGETTIDGQRIIDHLALAGGASYWWMTLLVEKSPWKSPRLAEAIRVLALGEIISGQRPARVRLASANRGLHQALDGLCARLGLEYQWDRLPATRRWPSVRQVFRSLPMPVQAVVALARHVRNRWPLRSPEKAAWFGGDRALFICSYFAGMDEDRAANGEFASRYWGGLHSLLRKFATHANWLEVYVRHDALPDPRAAMERAARFNLRRGEEEFHAFVDGYVSWPVIRRVLQGWLRLGAIVRRLGAIEQAFRPHDAEVSLWPLLRQDWIASMRGPVAIDNLLWIELFDRALADLPPQRRGLYLLENQGWERALVHAWRKHGHGQLIGVAHATVRFWDLRYYTDGRTLRSGAPHPIPQPDAVALNGEAAIAAYRRVEFPTGSIVECEALRFAHLGELSAARRSRERMGAESRVLVLGDYLPSSNDKLMGMLEAAAAHLGAAVSFTVKPHPYLPVCASDYPSLRFAVVADALGSILEDFDIAFSSNMTSASLDAYLAGLPVVVMLDDTELNYSPLRGQAGVRFVSGPRELAEALLAPTEGTLERPAFGDFLFLNPALPRWSRLLAS